MTSEEGDTGRSRAGVWAEEEQILKGPRTGRAQKWGSCCHRDLGLAVPCGGPGRRLPASPSPSLAPPKPAWASAWQTGPLGPVQIFFPRSEVSTERGRTLNHRAAGVPRVPALLAHLGLGRLGSGLGAVLESCSV